MIKTVLLSVSLTVTLAMPAIATAKSSSPKSQVVGQTTNLADKLSYRGELHGSVWQEYRRGVRQYEKGNFNHAKRAFQKVVDKRRQNYYASMTYLGLIAVQQDNHKVAVRYLNTALRQNPNIYGLQAALGLSYLEIGETDKARSILENMKRKQHRHYLGGSNEAERQSSITVLEQELAAISAF